MDAHGTAAAAAGALSSHYHEHIALVDQYAPSRPDQGRAVSCNDMDAMSR